MKPLPTCANPRTVPRKVQAWLRSSLAAGLSAALLGTLNPAHAEEIVVIVNKDNPHAVNTDFVMRVYTGRLTGWPDGSAVRAYDQFEDADARKLFCAQVLRKSPANVKAIWSQNIFTGKGLPPKVAGADAAVKALVSTQPHALGYIRASQVDDTVKVVGD